MTILNCVVLLVLFGKRALSDSDEIAKEGMSWEYCQGSFFNAHCQLDEVIIIESARYGHIQLGRCIDIDFGHFGCETDQLSSLDRQCSGKPTCEIVINDNSFKGQLPCSPSLVRYLEAQFECQKVYQVGPKGCTGGANISVKPRVQYIASTTTKNTNCGTETQPWKLEAKPGQHINISIIDFHWKESDNKAISHPCPVRNGYIIDATQNEAIDICGGTSRQKHLHLSKGSSVQIIINANVLLEKSFIVSYQAIGCPTFTAPADTWVKQDDTIITVGCNHNDNTWKMRCIGSNWIGISGNCEAVLDVDNAVVTSNADEELLLGLPPVVTLTSIGGVFLVIVCVVITFLIGIFCINKSKPSEQSGNNYYLTPMSYDQTLQSRNPYPSYRPVGVNATENMQSLMSMSTGDNPISRQAQYPTDNNPHYFVLEKDDIPKDSVYDVVYENA